MFPDPTIQWRPYPSIIDGIKEPFALDRGLYKGVLHLIVVDAWPESRKRAYGVKIRTDAYLAIEEFIYSTSGHGDRGGAYDGRTYVREAAQSRSLEAFNRLHHLKQKIRHYSFVGNDYCYEVLSVGEPAIQAFDSEEAAYAWRPEQT